MTTSTVKQEKAGGSGTVNFLVGLVIVVVLAFLARWFKGLVYGVEDLFGLAPASISSSIVCTVVRTSASPLAAVLGARLRYSIAISFPIPWRSSAAPKAIATE